MLTDDIEKCNSSQKMLEILDKNEKKMVQKCAADFNWMERRKRKDDLKKKQKKVNMN